MADIYNGIVRDLPAVREFFELPTHESAARILAEEWRDSVIFESFGKGFASSRKAGRFYRRMAGGWYESFDNIINATSDLLEEKATSYFSERLNQFQHMKDKIDCTKNLKSALICAKTLGFIKSALIFLSAVVEVPDLSSKWNSTTDTVPILDGIADFSGPKLIIRQPAPNEYYKNPLQITTAQLIFRNDAEAFLRAQYAIICSQRAKSK